MTERENFSGQGQENLRLTEELRQRVESTIDWYYHDQGAATRERSVAAVPSKLLFDAHDGERKHIVNEVIEKRAQIMKNADASGNKRPTEHVIVTNEEEMFEVEVEGKKHTLPRIEYTTKPVGEFVDGKLMAYHPERNLFDGMSAIATHGFLDAYNEPGWDTWVDYVERGGEESFLIAWVPEAEVELVDNAIMQNPEGCIRWLHPADLQPKA